MLNMTSTCAHCPKPVAARGLTCDSCLGEAHRPRPKRRAKTIDAIIPPTIVEPPVYASRPPEEVPAESMARNEKGGLKYSAHKMRPSLVPVLPWWELVRVLTFGAAKYTRDGIDGSDNWKKNEPSQYLDALERHIAEWKMGRMEDPESGLHPLGHAAASLMFLLWFELTGRDQ